MMRCRGEDLRGLKPMVRLLSVDYLCLVAEDA
jgi:hypothetical protein